MGLLTDILKEIPQAAVLKEKIADIEAKYGAADTENAILKDDLRQAKAEIAKLTKQVEDLTHKDDLDPLEIKLLQWLGTPARDHQPESFAIVTHEHITRVKYHLGNLKAKGYCQQRPTMVGGPMSYYLTHKGQEYLVKNNLL